MPRAAASHTKVSKPVLFALKMTDFQRAHKLDLATLAPGNKAPYLTHSGAAVI